MEKIIEVVRTVELPELPTLGLSHMFFLMMLVGVILLIPLLHSMYVDRREAKKRERIRQVNEATTKRIRTEKLEQTREMNDPWRANLNDSGVWYKDANGKLHRDTYIRRNHDTAVHTIRARNKK